MIYRKDGKHPIVVIEKDEAGKKHYCVQRKNSQYDYENCPLNTGKKLFLGRP
jgi:hypothetical protein